MKIQLNTDKSISGNEKFEGYLNTLINGELHRFIDHITRIEVHLSDENGHKKGDSDKRCMLEARLEHRQPIVVTSHGNTLEQAIGDALDKLKTSIDRQLRNQ